MGKRDNPQLRVSRCFVVDRERDRIRVRLATRARTPLDRVRDSCRLVHRPASIRPDSQSRSRRGTGECQHPERDGNRNVDGPLHGGPPCATPRWPRDGGNPPEACPQPRVDVASRDRTGESKRTRKVLPGGNLPTPGEPTQTCAYPLSSRASSAPKPPPLRIVWLLAGLALREVLELTAARKHLSTRVERPFLVSIAGF